MPPHVEIEQEQQRSSDEPGNTTPRPSSLTYLVVRNRTTSGPALIRRRPSDATTPDAEAENGLPEMKTTKTPASAA